VPREVCSFIRYISASAPKLPKEHKVDETRAQIMGSVPRNLYASANVQGFPQGSPMSPFLSILALEDTLFHLFREKVVQFVDDGLAYGSSADGRPLENKLISENHGMKVAGIEFARQKCG